MKKLFRIIPLRVALTYLFFAGCWIYFSGKLINLLTNDPHVITEIETYKGFAFVLVTTILLYVDIRKRLAQLEAEHEALLAVQQELTQEENKYRNLFEHSPYAIMVNVQDRITLVNQACLTLFGAKDPSELIGKSPYDVFHSSSHTVIRNRIQNMREKGGVAPEIEEKIVRMDGRVVDVVSKGAPFSYGSTNAIHVMLLDITEKKKQEAELKLRNKRLSALFKLSEELRKAESSNELLKISLKTVTKLVHSDSGTVSLLSEDKRNLEIVAVTGKSMVPVHTQYPANSGLSGLSLELDYPYKTDDCSKEPRFLDLGNGSVMGPAIYLPLHSEREKLGVMAIVRLKKKGMQLFTRADVQLVNAIGELVGNTLRRLLLFEQSERRLHQSQALRRIDLAILKNQSLEKTIRIALEEIRKQFQAEAVAVRLKNMEGGGYALFSGLGFPAGIRTNDLEIDQNDALLKILKREKILVHPDDSMSMPVSHYLDQVRDHGFGFYAAVPFYTEKSMAGVLELFQKAPRILSDDDRDFLQTFSGQMAIALENANLLKNLLNANQSLIRTYDTTIEGWSRALDMRDKETEGHTLRVTVMTLELARKMHFSEEELVHVRRGALLHDIGKMGVPDHILLKADALTEAEWKIMKQHPQFAYDMLSFIEYLRPALDIPYCHHEKWDGSGYPRGLKGDQIPKAARIFAVVDVWDALRSDRPYRPAWPQERVLEHIRSLSGTHFDPEVVAVFFDLIQNPPEAIEE